MSEWQKVKLGDICNFVKGETGIAKAEAGEYPLVVTGKERKICDSFQLDCKAVCIPLVSSSGHGKASLNYVHYQEGKFALGSILVAVIPKDENIINAQFLHLYLSRLKDSLLVPLMKGSANVALSVSAVKGIEISLPKIEKQIEIINLFNQIDLDHQELAKENTNQKNYLTQLRQAILQEAIEGKLTADWRVKNPVQKGNPDHDAQALLAKIQVFWKENKTKSRAITNGQYIELLPELNSWIKTDIDSIGIVKIGGTPSRDNFAYWQKDVAWVSSGEVANCEIFDTREYISHEGSNNSAAKVLPCGSVLVAMIGQSKTRGQSAILRINAATNQNVCGIVINHGLINEKYLHYYFLSRYEESRTFAAGGNQPALNGAKIGKFLINLPPLAEQNAIVERVDRLLESVNALEQQVKERKSYAEQLMQVVLKEAFTR